MATIPRKIGNYQLEHELGRGATSVVWLGRHLFLHERAVAVKLLLSHDEESVLRFSREAVITSQLRHPHIIEIFDHATPETGFPYTVMELIAGGSLRDRVEKEGRLALREAITIFRQIGSALDYAHSRGIVHRDVSPGNILLDATSNRAVLTDFGIARVPNQRHTSTDLIMGTPGFFSPEHAQSATAVTPLSDLFSLGVILYYMLTGDLPWETPPQHPDYRFGDLLSLAYRGVELPLEVERIVQTMLARDPRKRFPSAGAALQALERALARAGIMLDDQPLALSEALAVRAINTAPGFQSRGLIESEVEQVLAVDLLREPFERSRERAEELRDPLRIAQLLDAWSQAGGRFEFRRAHLGRIVNLRQVASRNVYFYRLNVVLETRSQPQEIEEPDADAPELPVQREVPLWQVQLPPATEFSDDPGRAEIIPGSERVIACPRCESSGYELCHECKGARRVLVSWPVTMDGQDGVALQRQQAGPAGADAATTQVRQVLVPCHACSGMGKLTCSRCQGAGRLVQRKAFEWRRRAVSFSSHDDLPNLDEARIRTEVNLSEVYHERRQGGWKREWLAVPGLKSLIEKVQQEQDSQTQVVLCEVTIQMIPYTEVYVDLGRSDVTVESATPERRSDDAVHLVQIYGFENRINIGPFAYDGQRKLLFIWSMFATLAALVLLLAVLAPLIL